jgi:hypothetical protein
LAIVQKLPAVLADGRFLGEVEEKATIVFGEIRIRILDGFHNSALHVFDKCLIQSVAMEDERAGRMMSVSAIDQDVGEWDPRCAFNFFGHRIELVARHHQDVAGDKSEFAEGFLLEDDGDGAKLSLLPFGFARRDATGNHHLIITFELSCSGADAQSGET